MTENTTGSIKEVIENKEKIKDMISDMNNESYINMIIGFVKSLYDEEKAGC